MNQQVLVQRFVDGDLDAKSRQQFLRQVEQSGDAQAWKQLALAFAEKQILDQSLLALANAEMANAPMSVPKLAGRPNLYSFKKSPLLGIAALILVLLVGYVAGAWSTQLPGSASQLDSGVAVVNRVPDSIESLPLALSDALARRAWPIPDDFRRDLLQAGYVLNEDQQLEQVELPFGGTIEVPVRSIDIRFLGQSAYQ